MSKYWVDIPDMHGSNLLDLSEVRLAYTVRRWSLWLLKIDMLSSKFVLEYRAKSTAVSAAELLLVGLQALEKRADSE